MLKGYRTVVFNVIMTGLMLYRVVTGDDPNAVDGEMVGAALDKLDGALVTLWGAGNAFLRAITDSPIGSSTPGTPAVAVATPAIAAAGMNRASPEVQD